MIEQEGWVVALDGDMAEVVIARQSACGSCQAKSGCGTAVVSKLFPDRELALRLPNSQRAVVGERIVVGLPEAALQLAALLLYGLPLLTMIGGAIAAESLVAAGQGAGELPAIIGGLLGLLIGLAASRRLGNRTGMRPVMLRRLPAVEVGIDLLKPQHSETSKK